MEDKVLTKIKPGKKEEEKVRKFVSDLLRIAKTVSGYDCVIVGSIGKGTWLAGDHDIDLFIMFPPSVPREELEKKGLDFGQKIAAEMKGKWKIKYAEHPYTHALVQGYEIDVVPCYRIAKGDRIISAVDRSPLHLEYVIENLTPGMQDQVRLLKQFCKGSGVYGSDAKNLGFSGYICELLVIRYGSFRGVLESSSSWEIPHIVDIEVQRERHERDFPGQPFIVIDPTDPSRNAAANVSSKNLILFIRAAKKYLAKPSVDAFFLKPLPPLGDREISLLKGRSSRFFALVMAKPEMIDDVLYPQLRKALYRVESLLKYNEFLSLRSYEFVGKSVAMVFELENWVLPGIKKMVGPPVFSHAHSREFISKYGASAPPKVFGPYLEDNRWIADRIRDFCSASDLLADLLKKKPDELQAMGIPKYIAGSFRKGRLIEGEKFFALVKKDKALSAMLREAYFEKMVL
jgi:tRNA nucleotidyltransferase (CCA-adding enzyme)